jgi:L-cysteine/cystine lyase
VTFEEARKLFPVLRKFAYLNAGTFGPLPAVAGEIMRQQNALDVERGRSGKPYFEAMIELRASMRARVAALLCAEPERVALTSSTTDGCNIVLAGLGLGPDDEIVTTDSEHFGLAGPVFASGAQVRVARVQQLPAAEVAAAIAAEVTGRTKLVATSHVLWTNGHVVDVHALRRETGVPILVDGAQSVGAIPVEVGELDYYTVSGQKWLCGPESTGALYVRDPERLKVARPSYLSQQSFEPGGRFVPTAGAVRFEPGWVAVASMRAWAATLELAPDWRFERIREAAARCREALLAAGVEVVTEAGQAGLVTFRPDGDAADVALRAYEQGVVVRDLPGTGWVRASCGWWTSDDDVDRLVAAVAN